MICMYASDISQQLYNWTLAGERYAKIHSVFKSTINILSDDGRFIPVVISEKPMSPNSIRLGKGFNFDDLNISIGEVVLLKEGSITNENIQIIYRDAQLWDDRIKLVTTIDSYDNIIKKLGKVKIFILNKGNKNGIFKLLKYISKDFRELNNKEESNQQETNDKAELFIKERFISFIEDFKQYDIENINIQSKKIIGFGPGLTPSMDDFLSGMMIANLYISHAIELDIEMAYNLNTKIVEDIENKTTLVSEEMLKQSSIGQINEDIRGLMISIISRFEDNELEVLMEKVIDFGHSSGTDILCGIYIGSIIIFKNYKN